MDEVTPAYLREGVEFQVRLRGYDPAQVDELLERVAGGIELLQQQLRQALERAARAEHAAADAADTDRALRATLVTAQRTAEQVLAEAREEAASIVSAARAEADRVAADAQGSLRADIVRLESARDELTSDVAALESYLEAERGRLRQLIAEQLDRIDGVGPARLEPPPPLHDVTLPPPPDTIDDPPEADADRAEADEPMPDEPVPGEPMVDEPVEDTQAAPSVHGVAELSGEGHDSFFGERSDEDIDLGFDRSRWTRRRRR